MAGHSQFKNIMHRKGAQDKKKAKIFTKINREISVAVKSGGPDANANPRLRAALIAARSANMPKDNIEKAIKKASGEDDGVIYEQITYEGYGTSGAAVIVECLTDNRNRSASDIRAIFSKFGGNMGASGSVSFMFDHFGIIKIKKNIIDFDTLLESTIEAGGEDVIEDEETFKVKTSITDLHKVNTKLVQLLKLEELPSEFEWIPTTTIVINEEDKALKLIKMLDTLEDHDDVQQVFSNFEISEDIINKIS